MGLVYSYRELVHYLHGGKHSSIQADMVLEEELRVLYLDSQQQKGNLCHILETSKPIPIVTTSSNKATPLNSAIPCGPSIQTHECRDPFQPPQELCSFSKVAVVGFPLRSMIGPDQDSCIGFQNQACVPSC